MRVKNRLRKTSQLCICLFFCFLFAPTQLNAQPDTLELHRIWAVDLDQQVTALRLADLDGDGTNEILVALCHGDSGHIQVFNGSNGILSKTSQKIRGDGITDMDVGDIDGDGNSEVVVVEDASSFWTDWRGSLACVLAGQELHLEWQGVIPFQMLTCAEVEDIDQDDTAEVFTGSYTWSYDTAFAGSKLAYVKEYGGALYSLDGANKVLHPEDSSVSWGKFLAYDIDHDSYDEIVCGVGFTHLMQFVSGQKSDLRQVSLWVMDQDGSRRYLSTLFTSYHLFSDEFDPPRVLSMAIGDCDSDANKEIVSYVYAGRDLFWDDYWNQYFAGPPKYLLAVTDAHFGILQKSAFYAGDVVSLAVFDIDDQPPGEILIARANGILQVLDGTTFDTVAIGDVLPAMSFLAFGDVTGDATPDICISDGDSLFLYGFGPTVVGGENEQNLASKLAIHQNYPNPFNTTTTIRYLLSQGARVELSIYNIKGQKVKTLVDGFQSVGFRSVTWDGTDKNGSGVASGVYFYRVKTDYSEETKKMVLMK